MRTDSHLLKDTPYTFPCSRCEANRQGLTLRYNFVHERVSLKEQTEFTLESEVKVLYNIISESQ
jgi:hypothetical protein